LALELPGDRGRIEQDDCPIEGILLKKYTSLLLLIAAFAGAAVLTTGLYYRASFAPASVKPPSGKVAMGAFSQGMPQDLAYLHKYDTDAGQKAKIVEWFQSWGPYEDGKFCVPCARELYYEGREQVVTWEPQDYTSDTANQPDYSLDSIISGKHDDYIRGYAQDIKKSGVPVYLRLMHEMNTDSYPYGEGLNGNTPDKYKQAWVHVYDIFQQEGATDVKWVWCPNVGEPSHKTSYPLGAYYPGDAYVDWIALDGYNWAGATGSSWYSFEEIFTKSYNEVLEEAPNKPLMIAEYASDERGGSKEQWIRHAEDVIPAKFPRIRALIWFNDDQQGALWRIDSSPTALKAYQQLVAAPYFQGDANTLSATTS
jgi:beta-mannanase